MVHLSHSLEDIVLRERLPAMLFTGFQESSHWRQETERYRALAAVAQQVCIFAGGNLPPESNEKQIHVTLQGEDPLRQEWFVCVLSPKFTVVLCGQDQRVPVEEEATRQFATLWTLDPAVVSDVLDKCEEVVAHYRPDRVEELREARRQYPPVSPDPALMTTLTRGLINFEERLQQSLGRTTRLLEQQLKWQEDMINLLVHDLRTPLQSTLLSIQMAALTGEPSADQQELLKLAETGTRNATELVQMMLDNTKLEHGQFPMLVQVVDVATLFERAMATIQALAQQKALELIVHIAPNVRSFWGDTGLLERVLVNLLNNAIKYTPRAGTISLVATLSPGGKHIELSVRDTGQGIPREALPSIFERLVQVNKNHRSQGSGLGLYFCKLAAEAHGGDIRVHSQPGIGSAFTLKLPLRPPLIV